MQATLYLLIAAVISYVASLQLGPVNLRVIQCTVEKNRTYALLVGIGGSLPEILYAGFAFFLTELLTPEQFHSNWMHVITIPVFLGLAIFNFQSKKKQQAIEGEEVSNHKGFWEGFVLALLNPQLITFWLIVIAYLKTKNYLLDATFLDKSMFILGSAAGAFVLQLTFIALATRYKDWILKKTGAYFDKMIGSLFLLLALADTIKLIKNLI